MSSTISRRKLLRTGGQAFIAGGIAVCGGPALEAKSSSKASAKGVDYYQKLGVTPFINAAGTYTVLSASTMPEEVQAAISLAARQPVNLNELLDASGEYLAMRLRCDAALVTAGAAAALVVGTAACVTRGNDSAILNIPTDMSALKNEVIIQKAHRYGYDHALRNCGIRFVEVETLEQYEQAFNDHTVMTHFFNAGEGQISREDWVRVAHQHGIPCFNDAAADVPPISNLWNYTQMGFDLVTFSDGKGSERIAGPLTNMPSEQTQVFIPTVAANHVPHLLITYDQNRIQITGAEVMKKMREGKPRIELNPSTGGAPASAGLPGGPNTIVVGVWMMQPGEDAIVAKRLQKVLQDALAA